MKIIEEPLKGFVNYNDKSYPFLYEKKVLQLFPPNEKEITILRSELFQRLNELSTNKYMDEWIGNLKIEGTLSNLNKITFLVQDFPSNNMGFISFPVQYYFMASDKLTTNTIDGIYISGQEVDYFYPSDKVVKVNFNLDGNIIESSTVTTLKPTLESMGSYKYLNKDVNLSVSAIPTTRDGDGDYVTTRSEIKILFSEAVNLEFVVNIYHHIRSFFYYICRRTNIKLNPVDLIKVINGVRHKEGVLIINQPEVVGEDNKAKKRIIKYDYLNEKSSMILAEISRDSIYLEHLQSSLGKIYSYGTDRVILNFVAFEREFRNIYGDNKKRSDQFYSVQKDIQGYVVSKAENSKGKTKKYFNEFKRRIERDEHSYADRFEYALNDCLDIVKPFLVHQYNELKKDEIKKISKRLNVLRNDSTHGNIDLKIEPIHLKDFTILEVIVYAMRLKNIKLETDEIQNAIKELMGFNISFR